MSRGGELGLGALAGSWIASLGLYLAARLWMNAQWSEPLAGPGGLVLLLVLLGIGWMAVEPPKLAQGGGGRLLLFFAALALLLFGQLLLWLRISEKERLLRAGLSLAFLAGGLLVLFSEAANWAAAAQSKWPKWCWKRVGNVLNGLAGLIGLQRDKENPGKGISLGWEMAAFGGLMVLAAGARIYGLGEIPGNWWYDEINLSRAVIERVLEAGQAPLYVAENVENPGMYLWAGAVAMKIFGQGVEAMRYLSAFYGFLALFPFYFLARRLLGPGWALAALAMFSCMRWTLIPERIAFMSGFALFVTLNAFYFFWRALQSARRLDYFCFGLALGATLHAYTPARLVAPLILLFMLTRPRFFKAVPGAGWMAFALGYILVAGPMLHYIATHWATFNYRSGQVSIMNDVRAKGWNELWVSFSRHLLMFNFRGDHQARHNIHFWPHLDFLSAAFFVPAWLWIHARFFKDARAAFLSLWFWVMLSAGVFSMTVEAPQGHRTILLAPMVPLALAFALSRLWPVLASSFKRGAPHGLKAAGLAALLAVPAFNAHDFFAFWPSDPATWRSFSPQASAAARRAMRSPADTLVLLSSLSHEYQFHGFEMGVFTRFFLKLQGRGYGLLRETNPVSPNSGQAPPGTVLAIWGESDAEITQAFKAQFPDIALEQAANPHDSKPDYLAAEIPWERIPLIPGARGRLPFIFRPS